MLTNLQQYIDLSSPESKFLFGYYYDFFRLFAVHDSFESQADFSSVSLGSLYRLLPKS